MSGKETQPTDASKLLEWNNIYDKEKPIIGLALSDSELHHIDLDKSLADIWDNINKLFGAQRI